jgi:hypothetical protein
MAIAGVAQPQANSVAARLEQYEASGPADLSSGIWPMN